MATQSTMTWLGDVDAAIAEAQNSNKIVFADFNAAPM
jgi:hypothetical protein